MSSTSTALSYIPRTINETEVRFAKISPRQKARILAELRRARRNKLVANLDAAGITGEQRYAELETFDDQPAYGEREWIRHVNSSEGQDDILLRSLRRHHPGDGVAEQLLEDFTERALPLVAELSNLELGDPEKKKPADEGDSAEGGGASHPTQPTGYDRPETLEPATA